MLDPRRVPDFLKPAAALLLYAASTAPLLAQGLPAAADLALESPVAAGPGGESAMGLGEVLTRIFSGHPQVAQAASELQATGYAISQARAGYFPYAQVQTAVSDKAENGNTVLSVVQPLWDGGFTRAQVDEARQRQAAALVNLMGVRLTLSDEALSACFDILDADVQLQLAERYIAELKGSVQTIERRAENGVASDADVQTAYVRLSQAEAARETVRARRISARSRLSSLLSGPPPAQLAWPDEKSRLRAEDIDRLTLNLDAHPLVQADQMAERIQKAVAAGTRASLWPQLSVQHREQLDGTRFDPSNNATLLVAQYQTTNGLRAYRGSQSEQARVTAAERKLEATRAVLQAQFRADIAQLLTYATQVAVQEKAATASTALVDSYRRQFEVGRKTWIELLNAQREAHEARSQLVALKRGYWQVNLKLVLQSLQWDRLGLKDYLAATTEQPGLQLKDVPHE